MTDTDLARLFTAAAEALEAASDEPLPSDMMEDWVRNSAFRTLARAFRKAAPKPAEPEGPLCSWCAKPLGQTATVRRSGYRNGPDPVIEAYHAECWDRKLRAESEVLS